MNNYNVGSNLGVVIKPIKESDYIAGENSSIKNIVLQKDRDFLSWLPTSEYQYNKYGDTYGCVTFSALNCLEVLLKRKYNIDINFSDRFTVVLSGTKRGIGNYMTNVGDSIRKKHGLIPESMFAWDRARETITSYYDSSLITKEMLDEGLKFLDKFFIQYEWVLPGADKFWEYLQYGPIQVLVNTKAKAVNGIIQPTQELTVNHAVTIFKSIRYKEFLIFDHYINEIKRYAWNFNFGAGLRYSITKKNMRLVKSTNNENKTVFFIDAEGNKRAFNDVQHFMSLSPVLGLSKRGEKPDWSQVELISDEELNQYPLGRPLYIVSD